MKTKIYKLKAALPKDILVMGMIFLALVILSASAHAGESCLNKEETEMLNGVRSREIMAKLRNPSCQRMRGAGACLLPADLAIRQFLERKENGDEKACAQPLETKVEGQKAEERESQ